MELKMIKMIYRGAALYYCAGAVLFLCAGFVEIVFPAFAARLFNAVYDDNYMLFMLGGLIFLAMAAIDVLIAIGLFKQKRAAGIAAFILSWIGGVWSFYAVVFMKDAISILFLIVNGLLITGLGYLLKSKKAV